MENSARKFMKGACGWILGIDLEYGDFVLTLR